MSDLPSMPFFIDAYEAATSHLTLEEDGAYNRLLRLCWRSSDCSVPNDHEWIARRLRVSDADFMRVVKPVIEEFFTPENGRLFQKRQRREFAYVSDIVRKRKEAGSKGGNAKALKTKETEPSKARNLLEQNRSKPLAPTLTPTPTHIEDTSLRSVAPSASKPKGMRLTNEWTLPKSYGDWALAQGLPRDRVIIEADKMRNWSINAGRVGVKVDWFAAWKNWVQKAIDELPRPRAPTVTGLSAVTEKFRQELEADGYPRQGKEGGDSQADARLPFLAIQDHRGGS